MSVAIGAGPSSIIAGSATGSLDGANSDATTYEAGAKAWSNIKPLDRAAAGAVGEWVDLLARISHDLRTPLNAVIGFSDVMQQELFGPLGHARYQEYVRHIRASGVELLQAAEDALAMTALLAEPRSAEIEDVSLLASLNESMDDLTGRFGHMIPAITIEVSENLTVRADRRILTRAIRQMFTIVLARAGDGGDIRVQADVDHGLVDFRVELSGFDGPSQFGSIRGCDAGLGRRDLGIWLATALLDQIDCRLSVDIEGCTLMLRTTLEETRQPSFFCGSEYRNA